MAWGRFAMDMSHDLALTTIATMCVSRPGTQYIFPAVLYSLTSDSSNDRISSNSPEGHPTPA